MIDRTSRQDVTSVLAICATRRAAAAICALALFASGNPAAAQMSAPDAALDPDAAPTEAEAAPASRAGPFTGEDGRFDVSGFLDEAYGFLPIAVPITEPAVGYGAALGLAFVSEALGNAREGLGRSNVTVVGGMRTENGTTGAAAGDLRYWRQGRIQTLVGALGAPINLDFYGIGGDPALAEHPLRYDLDPTVGLMQMKYRLGDSSIWAGLGYVYASVDVGFRAPPAVPGLPDFDTGSVVAGVLPSLTYDTRDNIFTPVHGSYLEVSGAWFDPVLGGDDEFRRTRAIGMHFTPLGSRWFLGIRADGTASSGDVPFYLRPYIALRGVPALRYQGDEVAQLEAELRWQCGQRASVLGFAGVGRAWADTDGLLQGRDRTTITSGEVGFRYEVARKYGIHVGIDVAVSEDDSAIYVQVGSAWARP